MYYSSRRQFYIFKKNLMKILITGVSKGLGKSLAKEFIARGHSVWGVARSEIEECNDKAGIFFYSKCDISNADDVKKASSEMIKKGFIPDIIILNAGYAVDDVSNSIEYGKLRENFNVNLFGSLNWVNEFLPIYIKAGKGTFAAISSLSIYRENHKNRIGYSASKLALNKVFENLRMQYHSSGIKFITLCAGRMSSDKSFIGTTYDNAAKLIAKNILSDANPSHVNFPALQYYLTRLTRFIPEAVYIKYIFK
jgi:3-oxoacyl-[acyl-carrier protein] reductase